MARIPAEILERLRREVDLAGLVLGHGVVLNKQGEDLVGLCPFHEESTPSFRVTPSRGLFHCFGCGAAGDAVAFVMKKRGLAFRHAVELLMAGPELATGVTGVGHAVKLPCPFSLDGSDQVLLDEVTGFYNSELLSNGACKAYLARRGLMDEELIKTFKLGFANRTMGYRLPPMTKSIGAAFRDRLIRLGIYRKSGHEHLTGCLVVPIVDVDGHTVSLYGRRISKPSREVPEHLYLAGPHRGVFNVAGIQGQREVILCEALLDALTFWRHGFCNVTSAYGVEGLTSEIVDALKAGGAQKVLIAFDRDEAGERGAEKAAEKLRAVGLESARVEFPKGMDVNSYAQVMAPAPAALRLVLERAGFVGGGATKVAVVDGNEGQQRAARENDSAPTPPVLVTDVPNHDVPPAMEVLPPPPKKPSPPLMVEVSSIPTPPATPAMSGVDTHGADDFGFQLAARHYRVRGLLKNPTLLQMRVNITLQCSAGRYVDTLDMNVKKARAYFAKSAAEELGLDGKELEKEVHQELLMRLQDIWDAQHGGKQTGQGQEPPPMTEAERQAALEFLRDPRLLERILEDFERCGIVGEEVNKLCGYVSATSRLLAQPLALAIQSTSAAGKSSLMDAVLALMPEEVVQKYSAMTERSLYYMGETDLRHKILALAEEEGAEKATYALKLLQSEGRLSIASTAKDPQTGQLSTKDYRVEGPVMIFYTTTSAELDEELENRCIKLAVNEGREQTRKIHAMQRQRRTLEGIRRTREAKDVRALHHNAQRLLERLPVYNPFAERLTFPDAQTRMRRDNEKYLTLIDAVTLLHQHQRPRHLLEVNGETVTCVEVTIHDVAVANLIAHRVFGKSLDHIPPQTRRLLELAHQLVKTIRQKYPEARDVRWSRRDLREFTGWSLTQLRVHLERLVEEEYVAAYRSARAGAFEYELLFDGQGHAVEPHLHGLLDVEALRGRESTIVTWRGVAGWLRADDGPVAVDENAETSRPDEENRVPGRRHPKNGALGPGALLVASYPSTGGL